jgi:hypothetical protein
MSADRVVGKPVQESSILVAVIAAIIAHLYSIDTSVDYMADTR